MAHADLCCCTVSIWSHARWLAPATADAHTTCMPDHHGGVPSIFKNHLCNMPSYSYGILHRCPLPLIAINPSLTPDGRAPDFAVAPAWRGHAHGAVCSKHVCSLI